MPLKKTSAKDVVRIELPADGEWIEVKRVLGKDDEREIQRRTLAGQHMGDMAVGFDVGELMDRAKFATIEVAMQAWHVVDEETGKVLPITPANIRAIDDDSLEVIIERLNDLYPGPRTEEEVKPLSEQSVPPLSVVEHSRQSSAG